MFVNPISFNFTNSSRALKNNEGSEKPTPAEPQPQEESPKMKPALMQDTVSFGGDKKHRKNSLASVAAAAAIIAGPAAVSSCSDYESYHELNSSTTINLKDFHHCGCGDIPIVIPRDTVYLPGDTIYLPGDTIVLPGDTIVKTDTIWMKPDTVYIPKKPHFEINDSINKDIDDLDIPTEGDGDFVYAFQGRNEYLAAQHFLLFNGFFSDEKTSSFVDHAFEEKDVPKGSDKPTKYYYTRYDISSDYVNGRRLVEVYLPTENRHKLPNDQETSRSGWTPVGRFYVKNASVAETAQLIANDMDGTMKARITKNEHRGPGNLYKDWTNDAGEEPRTTIQNVKAYKTTLK